MSLRTNAHKMQISKTVRTTVVTYSLAMLGLWGCMGIAIADSLPQTFQPSNIPAITKAAQRAVENSGDQVNRVCGRNEMTELQLQLCARVSGITCF